MRVDYFKSVIAVLICGLIAYGFYQVSAFQKEIIAIGSFIFTGATLLLMIGIKHHLPRTNVLLRVVAVLFLIIALLSNGIFAFYPFSANAYVITNSILFLLYLLIINSLAKSKI